jgi:hypothetical protein
LATDAEPQKGKREMSKCPCCSGTSFKIEQAAPYRSPFKLNFVQCSACQTVVGVMEYNNIGALIFAQNKAINAIAMTVGAPVSPLPT